MVYRYNGITKVNSGANDPPRGRTITRTPKVRAQDTQSRHTMPGKLTER